MGKTAYSSETMVCISGILDTLLFGVQSTRDYFNHEYHEKKLSTTNISGYITGRYTFGSLHDNMGAYGDCSLVTLLGEESDAKDMHLLEKIENGVYSIESKSVDNYGWKYTFVNGVGNRVSARVFFDSLRTIHIKATCDCDDDPTICLSLSHAMEENILSDILEFLPELDIALMREVIYRSGLNNPRIAIERMIAFGAYRTRLLMDILKHSDERIKILGERLSINCRRDKCDKCGRCNGKLHMLADDALVLSMGQRKVDEDAQPSWANESHLPLDVMEYASCEMFSFINKDFPRFCVPGLPYLPDIGNKKEVYFPERTDSPMGYLEDDNDRTEYYLDRLTPPLDSDGDNTYTKTMLRYILLNGGTDDTDDATTISNYTETQFYHTRLLPLIGLAFDPRGPQRLHDRHMSCSDALTYVIDSEKIYEKLKDGGYPVKSCINERCKTWKHALSICDKNHAIFNDIDWVDFKNGEPMKCEIKLPRWMERLRIKSKEAMVAIGENMHNCLRNKTESSNLFFHWHNCALELSYGANPHVVQCYDKFNRITPDSTKMKNVFTKYVQRHINLFLKPDGIASDENKNVVLNAIDNHRGEYVAKCKYKVPPEHQKNEFQINIYLVKKKINLRTFFAA